MFLTHTAGGARLRDFKVVVSNYPWSTSPGFLPPRDFGVCFHHEGPASDGAIFTADCRHLHLPKMRYVYVVKEDTDTETLTLCEVQVFAECKYTFETCIIFLMMILRSYKNYFIKLELSRV